MKGGAEVTPAVTLNYGNFIQTTLDFIIIALAIFLLVKGMNALNKKKKEEPKAPAAPPADIQLLTEIRDLLKREIKNRPFVFAMKQTDDLLFMQKRC